jgi:hypothetical protein
LLNSQVLVQAGNNVAPISVAGIYSIINTIYDKPGSTLTGTSTNSVDYFQYIDADNITTKGLTVTGSINVSGSVINNLTSSFAVSASQATTASYVVLAQTASYALNATSASYSLTSTSASYASASTSASYAVFATSASFATQANSAFTASSADNFLVRGTLTAQTIVVQTITSSISVVTGSMTVSGALVVLGGITGSLNGTASWANNATTASYALTSTSASYATTAGVALSGTGSFTGSFTGSLLGTASRADNATSSSYALFATSASYASASTSASYALNTTTASYALNATSASYSLNSTSASYSLNSTSASYALTASFVPTSSLTGNFFAQGGNSFGTQALLGTNDVQNLAFETSGSIRMTISSSGNVGIGNVYAYIDSLSVVNTARFYDSKNQFLQIGMSNDNVLIRADWFSGAGGDTPNIVFQTGNTERMRIAAGGNVGIGTTVPKAKLHVWDSTNFGTIAIGNYSYPTLLTSNASSGEFRIDNRSSFAAGFITFYPNGENTVSGSEAMRINVSGSVGIGTTTPIGKLQIGGTSGNLLTVGTLTNDWYGDVAIGVTTGNGVIISKINTNNDQNRVLVLSRDDAGGGGTIIGYKPSGLSNAIGFRLQSTGSSYFDGGNVGIGSTSPARKLDVNGTSIFRDFTTVVATNGNAVSNITWLSTDSGIMNIYTGGSATVQLNSSGVSYFNGGSLGIGTTAPTTPLRVDGGAAGTGGWNRTATLSATYPALIFNSNNSKWGGLAYDYSAAMRFWVNASSDDIFAGTMGVSILNSGNVGIGTSNPSFKLEVSGIVRAINGTIFAQSSGTEGSGYQLNAITIGYDSSNTYGWITAGGAAARTNLVLQGGGGNVGIGTATPSLAKLQVQGNVSASSYTGSLFGTASFATSASYALTSTSASYALSTTSASYATTAGNALLFNNTGSSVFATTGSNTYNGNQTVSSGYVILSQVSASLNFVDDAAAAANGVPLGGLYRNGNFIMIRIS